MPKTSRFNEYLFSIAVVAVSTALSFAMVSFFEPTNLIMIYLLGTLAVASRGRRGPAAVSCFLSVLCFDYFFVHPRFSFAVSDAQYVITFVVMFLTAMVISGLTVRLRTEAENARESQRRTALMYSFTQQLSRSTGARQVMLNATDHIATTFESAVTAFLPDKDKKLKAETSATEKELAVAQWAYERDQAAGLGTASLPDEESLYVPLAGAAGPVGVLGVKPKLRTRFDSPEQRQLLDSFAKQTALALEVERFQQSAKKAEVDAETERLRSALLSSVSHDLRTPLTAIVGSASTLLGREEIRKNAAAFELADTIQSEGERLSRLVQNLLETTRLESGLQVRKELYPLEEVIGSALERVEKPLGKRAVSVTIPEDFPPVPMDGILIEQVFINLLENAARHTPADSTIRISVESKDGNAAIAIADNGSGLGDDELDRVFEKFYHGKSSPGAGLGLAICRAIVDAHGGRIWAANRVEGGATFSFTLPLEKKNGQ